MGLFSKTPKAKAPTPQEQASLRLQLAEIAKDGRMHARTQLHDASLAQLTLAGEAELVGQVLDLSYGGIAACFDKASFKLAVSVSLPARLRILSHEVAIRISVVRVASYVADSSKILAGLCIHHELPASLLFMREFLEPARNGASLSLIARELRPERFQGAEWQCWRGDGPTDLILKQTPAASQPVDGIMTFRMNKAYCEVTLKQGVLNTGQTPNDVQGGPLGAAATIASTAEVDKSILRSALFTLLGGPEACRAATAQFADMLKKSL